eukprot:1832996-Rhodomonas_salina.2
MRFPDTAIYSCDGLALSYMRCLLLAHRPGRSSGTGIGYAARVPRTEHRLCCYQAFEQGDMSSTRDYGGTG